VETRPVGPNVFTGQGCVRGSLQRTKVNSLNHHQLIPAVWSTIFLRGEVASLRDKKITPFSPRTAQPKTKKLGSPAGMLCQRRNDSEIAGLDSSGAARSAPLWWAERHNAPRGLETHQIGGNESGKQSHLPVPQSVLPRSDSGDVTSWPPLSSTSVCWFPAGSKPKRQSNSRQYGQGFVSQTFGRLFCQGR